MTDEHDEPDDQEPDPSPDDLLEALRHDRRFIARPQSVGPVIGSKEIVRADIPDAAPVRQVFRMPSGTLVGEPLENSVPLTAEQWERVGVELDEQVGQSLHATRFYKTLEWGPNEWRRIPDFPTYMINGYTRVVWALDHYFTKAGQRRKRKEHEVGASNSSVTLSHLGKQSGHGIEKLWRLTFPEYVIDENSWQVHSLRKENIPGELGRVVKKP